MRQVDQNGDIVFDSKVFGSGSVDKTSQIAEILKELLANVTIRTESKDTELILADYYKKSEIDFLLQSYAKLDGLEKTIQDLVSKMVEESLRGYDFDTMKSDLNSLNKIVSEYSETIQTIKSNQEQVQSQVTNFANTINDFRATIDSNNTLVQSYNSRITTLENVINSLNLLDLSKFAESAKEITDRLTAAENDISDLKSSVGTVSLLCQYDRPSLSSVLVGLTTAVNGIPSSAISSSVRNNCLTLLDEANDILLNNQSLTSNVKSNLSSKLTQLRDIIDKLSTNAQFSQSNKLEVESKIDSAKTTISEASDLDGIDTTDLTTYSISLISRISQALQNTGDLTSLKTTQKDDLVQAINELFQSASNGKSTIAAAITGKGITAAGSESFESLATKISSIKTESDPFDRTTTYKNQELGSDNSQALISNKSGVFILTSLAKQCKNGDSECSGDSFLVIDGVEHNTNEYNLYDKVRFNSSLAIKCGALNFSDNASNCPGCNGTEALMLWSGVLITK